MRGLNRVDVVLPRPDDQYSLLLVKIEYQPRPSVRALIISSAVGVVVLWPGELWARVAARAPQLPVDTGQDRMCGPRSPCVM